MVKVLQIALVTYYLPDEPSGSGYPIDEIQVRHMFQSVITGAPLATSHTRASFGAFSFLTGPCGGLYVDGTGGVAIARCGMNVASAIWGLEVEVVLHVASCQLATGSGSLSSSIFSMQ